ncbi:MAG: hypothetical protein U1E49_08025 [Hyphomicrobiaceae bacterium]
MTMTERGGEAGFDRIAVAPRRRTQPDALAWAGFGRRTASIFDHRAAIRLRRAPSVSLIGRSRQCA